LDRKKTKRGKKTQDSLRQKEESSMWWLLDGRRKKKGFISFFFRVPTKNSALIQRLLPLCCFGLFSFLT
jgi:hypothetical protein